ncbi:DUF5916 domain-containing protein [Mucilaginibacter sp.]|uniref:carbohydrate binding family 9 domain-containing protein n=1 Tax=Mucilaginibacter sp. TaxID=1882438 RepID=UPI0035BC89F3
MALLLVACIHKNVSAQQIFAPLSEPKRPHFEAERTSEKIVIDGFDHESAWRQSGIASNFIVAYPRQGSKASYNTRVRMLYDADNLYIYAQCDFPPGKKFIQVQNMRRDFGFTDNELFEVLIDPFKDPRLPVMAFCVTPYGTQMDIMHYADGTYDYKWDAVWEAASQIQDSSWTVEIAIPFSSLRYPTNSTEWSINFVRNIRHLGELSGWSSWPLALNESRMEYAGIITGIHPPEKKTKIRFEPYTLVNANNKYHSSTGSKTKFGGEIKYAINSSTILTGTINTDFAQADIDRQVINLTRSSIFFPEKRQYFLENSSLFTVGQAGIIQPFFSRRIGLSESGAPLTINGGLRLVHQDQKKALGLLVIKQNGDSSENGALFGVFRYKRNISRSLQLGGMGILRENLSGLGMPSYLNPVGVLDAFWRPNPSLFVRGMGSLSGNTLTHRNGSAVFSEVNFATNSFFADWFETISSKNYQVQTGYAARTDFVNTQPTFGYNLHKNWFPKSLAFFNPQITADVFHQASTGNFQEANVNIVPLSFVFKNLAQLNFNITSSWENLISDFTPVREVNIAMGNYHFKRYELYGLTNQGAHYSAEARFSTGGYYQGELNSYYLSLRAAPLPKLSLVVSYTRNDFKNIGPARSSITTHLIAPELRVAANPKLLLSTFYQYNTDDGNGSFNSRFSWEYRPLSFIYLVYNTLDNFNRKPFEHPVQQRNGILKVTYIRQL